MKFLSVCSGIEAASVAWEPLGWSPLAFSEIEKFPSAVLAHHWPDVPNLGDLTRNHEWPISLAPDLIIGGTPCQSFSVAGLRKGLADDRGKLALEFVKLVSRYRPRWVVWENVPGVLSSSGGSDLAEFLGALAGRKVRPPVDGWKNSGIIPGIPDAYGLAWRVLDAQNFGVPQRRRRVFLVAHLGNWKPAAAVLFEPESLRGDSPPSRETGQGVAPTISARTRGGGGLGTDFEVDGGLIPEVCPAVPSKWSKGTGGPAGDECQNLIAHTLRGLSDYGPGAPCLRAKGGDCAGGSEALVTHTLRGEGHDASEDGTGRGTALVPVAFAETSRSELRLEGGDGSRTGAVTTGGGKPGQGVPMVFGIEGGKTGHCLRSEPSRADKPTSTTYAIQERAVSENPSQGPDGKGFCSDSQAYTLEARTTAQSIASPSSGVRRLTPRECERLQGFPDDHTAIPWRGKPVENCPDGPRYKALGNSMAVPVIRWIGRRIDLVNSHLPKR